MMSAGGLVLPGFRLHADHDASRPVLGAYEPGAGEDR
jgi:hypothetical protein